MTPSEQKTRELFAELQPGDQVELAHDVNVGGECWTSDTRGTVVRTERRRHGLHYQRNSDDRVYSDLIVLRREDGELTTVTIDEFTVLRRSGDNVSGNGVND